MANLTEKDKRTCLCAELTEQDIGWDGCRDSATSAN